MGHTVFAAPAELPITLAEAKAQLRLDTDSADDEVEAFLAASVEFVEDYTRRALITRTIDYTIDYEWPCVDSAHRIVLPFPPLQSVTSITYVDNNGTTQTLASNQYQVNATGIEGIIEPAYGVTWPSVRRQMNAIRVRFVCGYGEADAVPERAKQAMKLLLSHWHEHRDAVNVGNIVTPMELGVDSLLFPLRVFY